MSHEQAAEVLAMMAQNPPPQDATPAVMRDWFEAAASQLPVAGNISITRVDSGPAGGDMIMPDGGDPTRLVILYHGGGFFFGSSRTHRALATNLARAAGCAVLAADYRLGPEHPAPAAHDDAFAVYLWALDKGHAADRIALAGDSAGGNMALCVALQARERQKPAPAALALMSPWVDLAGEGASYREVSDDPIVSDEMLALFRQAYLGDGDRKSPGVTPLYSDLTGLPPTVIHVGSREKLRDDAVRTADRLKAAGVETALKVFDGMFHTWQMYAPLIDEGMASIEACAAFMVARQAR